MDILEKKKRNYAQLILERGIGLIDGEILVMEDVEVRDIEFIRVLAEKAYELGAKDVVVHFCDQKLTQLKLQNADIESISQMPYWWVASREWYADKKGCYLRVLGNPPCEQTNVSEDRIGVWNRAITEPLKQLSFVKKENQVKWSAVAVANKEWASIVFPNEPPGQAERHLWDVIFKSCYVTEESGTQGWDCHIADIQSTVKKINDFRVRKLHFVNELGTDLEIELCKNAIFAGGICHCPEPDGDCFAPNIPTEEILSTPHKYRVNGRVCSSMPFVYSGVVIRKMVLIFQNGKVVNFSAEEGEDVLKSMLETDEGASYLGEVALVPYNSPIRKEGVLFYNTLFDENAACHLALGAGYTDMIIGKDRSKEALKKRGLNLSAIHVDFMFGTSDLVCIATNEDGIKRKIMEDGVFCI